MPTMNPRTAIAPTPLIRRLGAKDRWHIQASGGPIADAGGQRVEVACGQRPVRVWRSYQTKIAYNASEVSCYDCVAAAVSKMLGERAERERGGAK